MNWMIKKIMELVISCLILSILLILIIFNKITKLHLIHIIIVFRIFYNYSNGYEFHNHGFFNFVGFFFLLTLILSVTFLLRGLISLFYKNYYCFLLIILFVLTLIYLFLSFDLINCDDWAKGLNNTYIYNDLNKYGCQINFPKKCPYKILKYFQDNTKIRGINCSNQKKNSKNLLLKLSKSQISHKTKRIAYPLTNKDPICFLDDIDDIIISKYFLSNLIDIDNNTQNNSFEPEIIIDFSQNPYGEMKINVNYNGTLSKQRKKLEQNSVPYSNNIMVIYLDSVSRANSIRQLKKTMNFIEKFISYKGGYHPKFSESNYHSFQFFKYHSFIYHTTGNYPRLIYGEMYGKNKIRITKYLKENGFITSYASDYCNRDNTRTFHNLTISEVDDHQLLFCDPNKDNMNKNTIKCLYGRIHIEHLFEYINQFWRKYKYNRKFSLIASNEPHEGTMESLKYLDNIIFKYLNSLFNDNLFKESSIFLLSDHGVGMPSIYYFSNFYHYEEQLPMLYMIINDRKNISYKEQYFNIYENQQTFITAFDIYNTFIHLLYGNNYTSIKYKTPVDYGPKSPFGNSLFTKIDKKNRTTKNYREMVDYVCE